MRTANATEYTRLLGPINIIARAKNGQLFSVLRSPLRDPVNRSNFIVCHFVSWQFRNVAVWKRVSYCRTRAAWIAQHVHEWKIRNNEKVRAKWSQTVLTRTLVNGTGPIGEEQCGFSVHTLHEDEELWPHSSPLSGESLRERPNLRRSSFNSTNSCTSISFASRLEHRRTSVQTGYIAKAHYCLHKRDP